MTNRLVWVGIPCRGQEAPQRTLRQGYLASDRRSTPGTASFGNGVDGSHRADLGSYHGNFVVGNLNTFPVVPGSSGILEITPSGQIATWASE